MPNLSGLVRKVEKAVQEALRPKYTLDVVVQPDNPNATTEIVMFDDDRLTRLKIGKRNADYGLWMSRKNFELTDSLDPRYLSFSGSLLTPRIKYALIIPMELYIDDAPASRTFTRWQFDSLGALSIPKDYVNEVLSVVGFYRLNKADGSFDRVLIQAPWNSYTAVTLVHDEGFMDLLLDFYLITDPLYESVDIELFAFSNS